MDSENNDPAAIAQFSWMPQTILHAAHVSADSRLVLAFTRPIYGIDEDYNRAMAELIISQYILPLPSKGEDEVAWTEQFLMVMKYLDDRATIMLLNMSGLKQT